MLLPQRGAPHVVGFAWPGNQGVGKVVLPVASNLFFFPEDEFHALQTGKVFADWLILARQSAAGPRSVDVIAHSLGNMLVNSGLQFLPAGTVSTYVMNDAAVPAEAFDPTIPVSLDDHARAYGYPDDDVWAIEWTSIVNAKNTPADLTRCAAATQPSDCWSFYERWRQLVGPSRTEAELGQAYTLRWRQVRPVPWQPSTLGADSTPHAGPWRGFFAENRAKTRIVNTFHSADTILGPLVWQASQRLQKPNVGFLGVLPDFRYSQFWGQLDNTSAAEQIVFATPSAANAAVVRQWAELAHWFPATSVAAGRVTIGEAIDFSSAAPNGVTNAVLSHSYMTGLEIYRAWPMFVSVTAVLGR